MKVLIGCEESQTECLAFRMVGIEAYSCDTQPCSGGHPEWHYQCDVREIWNDNYDLIILHPPCTYLSNAGSSRLRVNGVIQKDREKLGIQARKFFMECLDAPAPAVCVENPSPSKYWDLPPCSQFIEPYMFGDPYKKRTLLWLKNLPLLMATNIVIPEYLWIGCHDTKDRPSSLPGMKFKDSKRRSKSFPGVAKAMALQWGKQIYF